MMVADTFEEATQLGDTITHTKKFTLKHVIVFFFKKFEADLLNIYLSMTVFQRSYPREVSKTL